MPSRLRPQQLDMRVIELVDLVLAGGRIEDDLVECKGEWPDPQKRSVARHLGGHANKAREEPIWWIIGLEEKSHGLTSPSPIELADWWASVASCFDPPASELEHHRVVSVGEQQAVTALRFLTDGSPYVIKGGGQNGGLEREVPIRDGTRTRSARRDELLRLLVPAVGPPSAQLLSVSLNAQYYQGTQGGPDRTYLNLTATVFFQQPAVSTGVVMLPAHLMHARLDFDGSIGSLRGGLRYSTSQAGGLPFSSGQQNQPIVVTTPTILHGVDRRTDGVVITGPGSLTVSSAPRLDGDLRSRLAAVDVVQMHLSFGVAGIERRVNLDAQLDSAHDDQDVHRVEWRLEVSAYDPWADAEEHEAEEEDAGP
jgi:hypothetical protein